MYRWHMIAEVEAFRLEEDAEAADVPALARQELQPQGSYVGPTYKPTVDRSHQETPLTVALYRFFASCPPSKKA